MARNAGTPRYLPASNGKGGGLQILLALVELLRAILEIWRVEIVIGEDVFEGLRGKSGG